MHKKHITNVAWEKILIFLRSEKEVYIGKKRRCRRFIQAVCWIIKTGAQWRALPEKYGRWSSVFRRFHRWSKKGVWDRLLTFVGKDADYEYLMLDATVVRAHACSAGLGNQINEGLGRSKGGFTSKIHALVDALGNPIKFILTAGQVSEITKAEELIGTASGAFVIADRGYDSDRFRSYLDEIQCTPVIPPRSNRLVQHVYDKHLYKERHLIECLFSKLKFFRRVFSRFDKTSRSFLSVLSFAGAIIWLR